MGLPLDVNGDECKLGNWYWAFHADGMVCGTGTFSCGKFWINGNDLAYDAFPTYVPAEVPTPPSAASAEVELPKYPLMARWVTSDGFPKVVVRMDGSDMPWLAVGGSWIRDDAIPTYAERLDIEQTLAELAGLRAEWNTLVESGNKLREAVDAMTKGVTVRVVIGNKNTDCDDLVDEWNKLTRPKP